MIAMDAAAAARDSSHTLPRRNKSEGITITSKEIIAASAETKIHEKKAKPQEKVKVKSTSKVIIGNGASSIEVSGDSASIGSSPSSWSSSERHYEDIEELKEAVKRLDKAEEANKAASAKPESGESDPGYESDSAKKRLANLVKLTVTAGATSSSSQTKQEECNPGQNKSLIVAGSFLSGAIYQSKLFQGSKLSPPALPPVETDPTAEAAKEEYDNLIEELIEVEEVASQMQELEEAKESCTTESKTFPVTMEIFSPVLVRFLKANMAVTWLILRGLLSLLRKIVASSSEGLLVLCYW